MFFSHLQFPVFPKNKYFELIKNIGFVLIGNIGTRLLGFIMLPFYTSILNPAEYGIMDLISAYVTLLIGFVTLQIQDSVFVFSTGKDFYSKSIFFSGGLFFCIVSVVIWGIFFGIINLFSINIPSFFNNIWIIYLSLSIMAILGYIQQFCRSIDKMSVYAASGFISGLVGVILSLCLLPKYPSGILLIYIHCIGNVIAGIYVAVRTCIWKYFTIRFNWFSIWKDMLKYSLPIVPAPIMCWALTSLNRPLIEHFCSLSAVGFFSVSIKFPSFIVLIWGIVGSAWQVSVIEEFTKNNFHEFFNKIFSLLLEVLCLAFCFLTIFAPFYMKILVNIKYFECHKYIPILSIGACFFVLGAMVGTLYLPVKKSNYFLYSSIATFFVSCIANVIFIPLWRLFGACITYSFCMAVEFLIRLYYSQKIEKIQLNKTTIFIVLLSISILLCFYIFPYGLMQYSFFAIIQLLIFYFLIQKYRKNISSILSFIVNLGRTKNAAD